MNSINKTHSILQRGRIVFEIESKALNEVQQKLDESFVQAVNLILACQGKLVTTGMGKSGQIAKKIASTFSSTGTAAVYLHPSESAHGDMGILGTQDVILALSYGGESAELTQILHYASRKNIPLIALTGKKESSLAKAATVFLDVKVSEEACPLGLAPTASSTATLAMGDALAMAVLQEKGFTAEDFAEYHPGGSLGLKLLKKVKDVMHSGQALPLVTPETSLKEVFSIMTHKDVRGAAGVVNGQGELIGVITDGDIRRRLEKNEDPFLGTAKDMMNINPRTIDAAELIEKALFVMEQFQIQMLFVLDKNSLESKKPVGILHIQDLLRGGAR
ncbi:MAG: KpsF/GutQ family sugar-phosphate isomerase [Pseudobdellovibrionaceae bacterium]